MFGDDFDYVTITKKATSHKNVFYFSFPHNTNNYLYILNRRYRQSVRMFLKQMENKKLISQIKK